MAYGIWIQAPKKAGLELVNKLNQNVLWSNLQYKTQVYIEGLKSVPKQPCSQAVRVN